MSRDLIYDVSVSCAGAVNTGVWLDHTMACDGASLSPTFRLFLIRNSRCSSQVCLVLSGGV